jgi:hypothetical protein
MGCNWGMDARALRWNFGRSMVLQFFDVAQHAPRT